MAIDGAPSALLNGAPSARCPHSESLLKAARIVVEYAVGRQQGIQGYAASRGNRRLAKLERLDVRSRACHAIQGDGGRAEREEEEQGIDGAQEEENQSVHVPCTSMKEEEEGLGHHPRNLKSKQSAWTSTTQRKLPEVSPNWRHFRFPAGGRRRRRRRRKSRQERRGGGGGEDARFTPFACMLDVRLQSCASDPAFLKNGCQFVSADIEFLLNGMRSVTYF